MNKITQEDIDRFYILYNQYNVYDNENIYLLQVAIEYPIEELYEFVSLWDRIRDKANNYVRVYGRLNHEILGFTNIQNMETKVWWENYNRAYFTRIGRPSNGYVYTIYEVCPEGWFYCEGGSIRWEDEFTIAFSLNELLIDDPEVYLTKLYTEQVEETRKKKEEDEIIRKEIQEIKDYNDYMKLKKRFESNEIEGKI